METKTDVTKASPKPTKVSLPMEINLDGPQNGLRKNVCSRASIVINPAT